MDKVIKIPLIILGFLVFFIAADISYKISKHRFLEINAVLLERYHVPSTLQNRTSGVVSTIGSGIIMNDSGENEKYITKWDCGDYGILTCDEFSVYLKALSTNCKLKILITSDSIHILEIIEKN